MGSIIRMGGSIPQVLDLNNAIINDFTIENTAEDITLGSPCTINGTLKFGPSSENLVLGDYDLNIGPKNTAGTTGTIDRTSPAAGWINATGLGKLVRNYSGDETNLDFPIGDQIYYTPVTVDVTSGTVATGKIATNVTNAAHPQLPPTATAYLTRYWDISTMDMGASFSANITATYNNANDRVLIGSYVYPSDIVGANHDGVSWDYTNGQNISPDKIKGTITGDRSFTGLNKPPFEWTGAINTQWGNTGNWNSNSIPNINEEVLIPSGVPNYPHLGAGVLAIGSNPNNEVFECQNLTIESGASLVTLQNTKVENHGLIEVSGNMWIQNSASDAFKNFSNSTVIIKNAGILTFH